jgi:glycosyltransferase involved in cell wall biosynthesis
MEIGISKNMPPVNILILESGFGKGGSSVVLCYELEQMNREIFNPIVGFYYKAYSEDINKLKNLGLEVLQFNLPVPKTTSKRPRIILKLFKYPYILFSMAKQELPGALRIAWQIRKRRIKLVVFNNDLGLHTIGFVSAKLARVPCVVRKGGYGNSRKITRMLSPYVNGFFAISHAAAEDQRFDYPKIKTIPVIYHGIPLKRFDPSLEGRHIREELGIPYDHILITSVSRIAPGKGHFELIQAAKDLIEKHKNLSFLLVGDDVEFEGSFLRGVKEQVTKFDLENYFTFAGWRSDVENILAATDIFVHCPTQEWMEGLGLVAIEAAGMGKPVVLSNNYGLTETAIDNQTGYIVRMGDPKAIVEAITKLVMDKKLRLTFGSNARKFAEEKFDSRKNVRKIEEFLLKFV